MAVNVPRRIMLATDLTPAGDRAFDRALQLADAWDADLIVCHVVESSAVRPWGIERRIRNAETELQRLVAPAEGGRRISRHIVIGDPTDRTLEHARDIGCDFLVTGPAHGKVLGEKLLGSTAARMVRRADVPVLAVRRRCTGGYRNVVAPVDFSELSGAMVERARACFPDATLTVLHAYTVSPPLSGPAADKPLDELEAETRARAIRTAEDDMRALLAGFSGRGATIERLLIEGEPQRALLDHVERVWPDLVVTGRHGRTGARADAIGSVAEYLLMNLPCDVLTVPEEQSAA